MAHAETTSCPLNCWDTCGFKVTVEDQKVTKVDGDPEHPITQGKICGRGRKLEARTNDRDRLLYPMKKMNGSFVQINWEQALDEIAEKMSMIRAGSGTTAVMHSHDYSNNGLLKSLDQRFFNAYGGVTEVVGSVCWGAGIEAQIRDFGNAYSHAPHDIRSSRQIVVWGRNAARTNIHLFNELQQAKKRGIPLTVIDPIFNAGAKLADLYVPVKPGTDGLLAFGIMKKIVEDGKQDKHFLDCFSSGFEYILKQLEELSYEDITQATDVNEETLEKLAAVYSGGPTSTFLGLGMQRYQNGGNTIRSIDALAAMSGNVGIDGGGANYANLAVGQSFSTSKLALPGLKKHSRKFSRMKQAEGILSADGPAVELMFITRSNPVAQLPDTNLIKKAFSSVDTIVAIDQYMNDSVKMADYILPSATVFEEEDIYYSSMYHHFINYGPKLVEPRGEAKSDLDIWKALSQRLGFGNYFDYSIDEFLEQGLEELKEKGITLERIKQEKRLELPVEHVPWRKGQFQTPSGKYEFYSERAAAIDGADAAYPKVVFPIESKENSPALYGKYPFRLLTIHPLRSNHSQHYRYHKKDHILRVEISREISTAHDIIEGDSVEVYNDRGHVQGQAVILKECHPDTINIDEGHGSEHGGIVNQLTPNAESDFGLGSSYYDCLVNIKKINAR